MTDEPEEKKAKATTPEEMAWEVLLGSKPKNRFRISPRVVRDIPTLIEVLREELVSPELWVFRGQSDWRWALKPKRGGRDQAKDEFPLDDSGSERHHPEGRGGHHREREEFPLGGPGSKRLTFAQDLSETMWSHQDRAVFNDWKAEALALIPPSLPRPSSDLEWLAIGQHHGLYTRLLDWTRNPLVGAYFAAKGGERDLDSAIFALRGLPALESQHERNPWEVRGVRLWHPPSLVERIGRQSGLFTLHQTGSRGGSLDLVSYAEGLWYEEARVRNPLLFDVFELALVKIRIEASARGKLREELKLLGVDEFFAFPDLEGLCRAYKEGRIRQPTSLDLFLRTST